jgi:hypothetical protein
MGAYSMSDTVKLPLPKFSRRSVDKSGRVEHDSRGNAVWVRTRASDQTQTLDIPNLSIADDRTDPPGPVGSGTPRTRLKPKSR